MAEECLGIRAYRTPTSHQSTAYKRKILERVRFDERYKILGDHEHFWRIMRLRRGRDLIRLGYSDKVLAVFASPGLSGKNYKQQSKEFIAAGRTNGINMLSLIFAAFIKFGVGRLVGKIKSRELGE